MTSEKELFEKVYEKPEEAPWNIEEPPKELVELVRDVKITPCRTIDIGCGAGNYSIYLASEGFDVTGIDISEKAIEYARQNATKRNVKCRFLAMNASELEQLNEKFDFVIEWGFLHHIMPEQKPQYIESIYKLLNPKGKYLSTCFNIKSPELRLYGEGKYRKSPLGVVVYYSSMEELRELFSLHFKILESKLINMGKPGKEHITNYFFMEKL